MKKRREIRTHTYYRVCLGHFTQNFIILPPPPLPSSSPSLDPLTGAVHSSAPNEQGLADLAALRSLLVGSPLHEAVYVCILETQEGQGFEDAVEADRQARSILDACGGGWSDPQGLALSPTSNCLPEECIRVIRLHVKADRKGIDLRAALKPATEYGGESIAATASREEEDPFLPLPPPSLRSRSTLSPPRSTAQPLAPPTNPPASSQQLGSRHGGQ